MSRKDTLREEIRSAKRYLSGCISSIENKLDSMAYNRNADIDIDELNDKEEELRAKWKEFDALDHELDEVSAIEKSIAMQENSIDNLELFRGTAEKIEKIKEDIIQMEAKRDAIFERIENFINEYKNTR